MSQIKAIIYTSTNEEDNLIFENEDILAISTNTKCIENENLPEFDIFPNSGTLTVKDRNLVIYNKAIEGLFDNYEYKVEYYLENQIIATHIINQRPRYDYEAKTCTFYLGNKLDKLSNQTFPTYVYPLTRESLDTVFYNLLVKIFNITPEDYNQLMDNEWGIFKTKNEISSSLSFKQYFEDIIITFPYISQTNSREALKTILLLAQCGMYLDKNNKLKLIRLDGYSNVDDDYYYNNVYKIEPRHINKGFVPSVILDNKFNQININCFKDEIKTLYGEQIYDNTYGALNFYTKNVDYPLAFNWAVTLHTGAGDWKSVALSAQKTQSLGFLTSDDINISKYQNNNLNTILEIFESKKTGEENPSISILATKTTRRYTDCTINANRNSLETYEKGNLKEIIVEEIYFPLHLFSNDDTYSYTYYYGEGSFTATANSVLNVNEDYSINKEINLENFKLKISDILSYIKYDVIHAGTRLSSGGNSLSVSNGEIDEIEIKAKALTFRIRGNVETISFEQIVQGDKTNNTNYDTSLQQTNELAQSSAYLRINSNNMLSYLEYNLLNTFNGGLHTGTVTTVAIDYDTYLPTDTSQIGRNKDKKIFEVGDKVMPFKGKPIINRVVNGVEEPVVFQIVDCETFNEGGAIFQNLVLREIKKPPKIIFT